MENKEEFEFETRLVVLNFMGLIPSPQATLSGSGSSSGSSTLERRRVQPQASLGSQSSDGGATAAAAGAGVVVTDSGFSSWQQTLPTLPEATLIERFMHQQAGQGDAPPPGGPLGGLGPLDGPMFDEPDSARRPSSLIIQNSVGEVVAQAWEDSESVKAVNVANGEGEDTVNSSPSKSHVSPVERQVSEVSLGSDGTSVSLADSFLQTSSRSGVSSRCSYIDVLQVDVATMVRSGALPPQFLPLKDELNSEFHRMMKDKSKHDSVACKLRLTPLSLTSQVSVSPRGPSRAQSVMTPETEVADYLRLIGDDVQAKYGAQLEEAVAQVLQHSQDEVDYSILQPIALELISHTSVSGWSKAAMLVLLSQKLAMSVIKSGRGHISPLVDSAVRLIEDHAAQFIVKKGGWHSITALEDEPISPSDIQANFPTPTEEQVEVGLNVPLPSTATETSTLVGDNDSQAGSVFSQGTASPKGTVPGGHTVGPGRSRDISLESVSSAASAESVVGRDMVDHRSPASPRGGAGASPWGGAVACPATSQSVDHQEEYVVSPSAGARATITAPPGECSSGNGHVTFDDSAAAGGVRSPSVENVRKEIGLLRQYSSELGWQAGERRRRRDAWWPPRWETVALTSSFIALVAAVCLYQRRRT